MGSVGGDVMNKGVRIDVIRVKVGFGRGKVDDFSGRGSAFAF